MAALRSGHVGHHPLLEWRAGALLVLAAAIVGLAIAIEGTMARALNGVGAVCWLVAGVLLARSVRSTKRWPLGTLATLGIVVVLSLVVPPTDLTAAVVGFAAAGALLAALMRERQVGWSLLVPAAWLPVHLAVAIGGLLNQGEASVRTDPPPTAALVPLAMVLAAAAGGLLVARLRGGPVRLTNPVLVDEPR